MNKLLFTPPAWFTLFAVYATNLGVGILFGFQPPLVALVLHRMGTSTLAVGAITAVSTVAVIVLGPWYPRILNALGLRVAIIGGIVLAALVLLIMPLDIRPVTWLVLRFLTGCGLGLAWIGTEIWLNRVATDRTRGRVMAVYTTVFAAGVVLGPVLLQWTGTVGARPFYWGALALALTVLPLLCVRTAPMPTEDADAARGMRSLIGVAPIVMLAALTAGLVESADVALLPLFGVQLGLSESLSLLIVTVFLAGNVALQLPIGAIADRYGRRETLSVCALVSAAGPLFLPYATAQPMLLWPLLFVWGGTMYGFYTQGIALLGDSYPTRDLAAANGLFIIFYCSGGIVGPSLGGLAMDLWRPNGFVLLLSGVAAVLFIGLRVERVFWQRRWSPD